MNKPWLASYPQGVPAEIDPAQYRSLVHMIDEAFTKYADRKAYVCMDKFLTYAEVDLYAKQLAAWLQSLGLARGARVAIMMPNVLQYPIAIAGVLRGGYTVVNVNPLYTPRELEHQLTDSGAEVLIVLENFAQTAQQAVGKTRVKHVVVATMGEMIGGLKGAIVNFVVRKVKKLVPAYSLPQALSFKDILKAGSSKTFTPVDIRADEVAFLQYTGGTTGVSKGAILTHRNVVSNVIQSSEWLKPALSLEPKIDQLTFVCALPLYHIFALTVCGLLGIREGSLNVLIPNPRDIPGLVKELGKYKVNAFPAVNTLYNGLLNNADFAKLDFSGYRCCIGGGMAVQRAVAERWQKITGCPIIEGYGLSETSPIVSANPITRKEYSGTIGLPFPSTDVMIVDEGGRPLPIGEAGEIAVRGPQLMAGYWNRPEETAASMTADGYFRTGDIGVMEDNGYIRIVDRKKDMILVSGFNVYPNEVESVAAEHPGVLESACVGVPDEHTGEAVKLFVVRKDQRLTEEELIQFCRERLTGYKRPRHVEFRAELPKTNVGKILRRSLRDEVK